MKNSFLKEHKPEKLPVKKACKAFNLSPSGYFKFLKTQDSAQKECREFKVVETFNLHKKTYGYRRVYHDLLRRGESYSEYEVRKTLKSKGLKVNRKASYKPKTTDSSHNNRISPRVFKAEETKIERKNQVWSTDITYLATSFGFLYLAVFLDLYSRKVVGWKLSSSLKTDFVLDAFLNAIRTQKISPGLIIHSDRGVQYTSKKFTKILADLQLVQSMSRKGNCYDNAYSESFFALLKREMNMNFSSFKEAEMAIFEWIDGFYNTRRLHSSLGYKTPVEFEKMEKVGHDTSYF